LHARCSPSPASAHCRGPWKPERRPHERGWLGLAGRGLIAAAMSLILLDASEGRGCDVALFKVALLAAALGLTLLGLSLFRLGVLLLSPFLIAGGLMMTVPFLETFIPAVYEGFAKAPGHPPGGHSWAPAQLHEYSCNGLADIPVGLARPHLQLHGPHEA